jgi:TPP-dependent pyruvate/acetoin dehydrogenase alpha subunit
MADAQFDAAIQLEIYRRMALISQNDEITRKAIRTGRLVTPYYSPKGQETIPAALSVSLRDDDQICTIYRGACKGRGGPLHVSHPETGVMVTTGIVGSSMPIANGLGWAAQLDGSDRVVIAYFGDGASNIGAFHEALNLASVWKLPVIFVCQNNQFGEHTRYAKATSARQIADRAVGYAMPGERIDGNDPFAVWRAGREAIARARAGEGPSLIEALTFRFHGHVMGDADKYMDKAEKAAAMAADPTRLFRARLIETGVATEAQLAEIERAIDQRIEAAAEFALASPWPPVSELESYVLAEEVA